MTSDEDLYQLARRGSRAAFEQLYSKYEKPIFGFINRKIGSRADAEEIFHDTMLAIFKGSEASFIQDGAFAGWLYKIADNLSKNKLRSSQRERVAYSSWHEIRRLQVLDGACQTEGDLKHVSHAAEQLSQPLREVFDQRVAGKSYEEMSSNLSLPIGTIKSRVHSMVVQLRKELKKWHAE